jgi:S-adenosylmethionine synthetase
MVDKLVICNLIANSIIEEFKKIDKNNTTEIYVTFHSRFFVIEGDTSIDTPINISEIAQSKLNELYEESELKNVPYNYIDLIQYDVLTVPSDINYSKQFHKYFGVSSILSKIVTSDKIFGQSNNTDKPYYFLGEYIANHLLARNLCKDVKIRIEHPNIMECDSNNVSLLLMSDSLIAKKEWCTSLVLDLFPFEHKEIINHLDLDNYNLESYILEEGNYPWLKKDKIGEMVLV